MIDPHPTNLATIEALAFDVDGTLTDGSVFWGPDGEEWKRFSFADIMGVSLARRSGFRLALISGEASPLVDRFAAKLKLSQEDVHKGCRDKASAVRSFAWRHALPLSAVCFMGDDVNDLPAMEIVGLSATPADAQPEVLEKAKFICSARGGRGAVRELVNALLEARGLSGRSVFSEADRAV